MNIVRIIQDISINVEIMILQNFMYYYNFVIPWITMVSRLSIKSNIFLHVSYIRLFVTQFIMIKISSSRLYIADVSCRVKSYLLFLILSYFYYFSIHYLHSPCSTQYTCRIGAYLRSRVRVLLHFLCASKPSRASSFQTMLKVSQWVIINSMGFSSKLRFL